MSNEKDKQVKNFNLERGVIIELKVQAARKGFNSVKEYCEHVLTVQAKYNQIK